MPADLNFPPFRMHVAGILSRRRESYVGRESESEKHVGCFLVIEVASEVQPAA